MGNNSNYLQDNAVENLVGDFSDFSQRSKGALGAVMVAGDWSGQIMDVNQVIFTVPGDKAFLLTGFVFVNTTGSLDNLQGQGVQIDAGLPFFLYDSGGTFLKDLNGTNVCAFLGVANFALNNSVGQCSIGRSGILAPGAQVTLWVDQNPGEPGRVLTLGAFVDLV